MNVIDSLDLRVDMRGLYLNGRLSRRAYCTVDNLFDKKTPGYKEHIEGTL